MCFVSVRWRSLDVVSDLVIFFFYPDSEVSWILELLFFFWFPWLLRIVTIVFFSTNEGRQYTVLSAGLPEEERDFCQCALLFGLSSDAVGL